MEETVKLAAALTEIENRRAAARRLAAHFGAEDLIVFVPDAEIEILLPATGFPQTLPQGAQWQKFVKECLEKGACAGSLPFAADKTEIKALGIADIDKSVLILLGGDPNLKDVQKELSGPLKMLGALFRAEKKAVAAEGSLQVSKSVAAQTRELAENLEATRGQLQQALVEAETANRLKDEFLATVSHELRTPLNAILGWARLLQNGELNQGVFDKAVSTILRSALSQVQLVEDLLDISRIITGKFYFETCSVDLQSVVETAIDTLRPAVEAKNIRLETTFDGGVPEVNGNPDRLRQIVWNLLSNAVKFTPEGGLIEVIIKSGGTRAEVVVRDSGIGIEREFLPYVFDRFRQSDSSKTRKYGGLGLGLAIVRQLAELHGGSVRAESKGTGQGAAFIVSLPLDRTDEADTKRILDNGSKNGNSVQFAGLRVLFVEDDEDARELTSFILTSSGAEVTVAGSAAEALELIRTEKFDFLISDLGMPDEDGYSLIKKIRQLQPAQNKNLPAIALTAYAGENDRQRALDAGFQKYLTKPVDQNDLVAALANLV